MQYTLDDVAHVHQIGIGLGTVIVSVGRVIHHAVAQAHTAVVSQQDVIVFTPLAPLPRTPHPE